eukprot:s270_g15.t1
MSSRGYGDKATGEDASLGKRLSEAVAASAQGGAGSNQEALSRDGLTLLAALQVAYGEPTFQGSIRKLRADVADELKFLTGLGPLAAAVQAPVFERFGLPRGQRGVILMKLAIRLISTWNPEVKDLAGDLREMLCLPREEEDITSTIKKAEDGLMELEKQISKAPLDVRGPLAEALLLPYKASPLEIAKAVPRLHKRAEELAEHHLARGRESIVGEGKLLPSEEAHGASDEQLKSKLLELFERYLQKMLSRVITPLDTFTKPPEAFGCSWARQLVSHRAVTELWGPRTARQIPGEDWLSLGVGVTVLDNTVDKDLVATARLELAALEDAGQVTPSKDPCNVGARSVWLHFESPEETLQAPPALRWLCQQLLGLPDALLRAATACSPNEAVAAPRLRVHPHIMAATYRRGAEYHCHKDSYSGTDNQRMVTVLLYLNDDWRPGDGGELRVYGERLDEEAAQAPEGLRKEAASMPDMDRFVDIAPLSGRIVMFRSRDVWHAVREPREQRWAMTLWAVAVLLLGPGKAALGLLRSLERQAASKRQPKGWELQEHKVISTYAVRGKEKKGTGRFQLFEDAKKRGHGGRSAGAKLRRHNAKRFFEKINSKRQPQKRFDEWGLELRRLWKEDPEAEGDVRGWPPTAVFFAGDLRLRRMLLDRKNPKCPLPSDTKLWIKVPAPFSEADPSLEALQKTAEFLCCGEVAIVDSRTEPEMGEQRGRAKFRLSSGALVQLEVPTAAGRHSWAFCVPVLLLPFSNSSVSPYGYSGLLMPFLFGQRSRCDSSGLSDLVLAAPGMTMLQLVLLGSLWISATSEDCHDQGQVGLMQLKTSAAFKLGWGKSSPKTPARSTEGATPAHTVRQFCNATGLLDMHGALQNGGDAAQSSMEETVLQSVAQTVEVNNVDKVAKDMFTMYICVRWVPDSVFWHLARQELAADLLDAVVDRQEHVEQAIAELYQTYKFVPLLCSNNINVFDEKDPQDHTYFKAFEGRISRLMKWLHDHGNGTVAQKLASVDEIFCGSANMNDPSCGRKQKFDEWMNRMTRGFGSWHWDAASSEEKWSAMASIFASFGNDAPGTPDWTKDMKTWKEIFPYHSFVSKQSGMPSASSPSSKQRFLACFGKRVASELHRRPSGRYVLTDQNNLGCHGFWDAEELTDMLERTVALWRPPTCQMALMTYDIKRKILLMYSQMSKTLFKALPSMVNDEELSERGLLTSAVEGPGPLDPSRVVENAVHYVDGMRVKAKAALRWPVGCEPSWFTSTNACNLEVEEGEYGTVQNTEGKLAVVWDQDEKSQRRLVSAKDVAVVPRGWGPSKTLSSRAWDMVSGIGSSISSTAESLVASLYSPRQTSLAHLFSGSVSKWIVCPIRNDADLEALDSQLGVEDPAMQDLQEEAYSSWTGHSAAVPGQSCTTPSFDAAQFPKSQSCEISELHSDHPEKYTQNGVAEPFLCPAKALLPASEQLDVLLAKRGQCFLHMTSEQLRHYQWMHNGDFPARRQYDRKPNLPRVEYELIKLLRVPEGGAGEVSYARSCSPEAMQQSPRFCRATRFHNKWATLTEIASTLGSAAVGSVAMGTASITMTLSSYGQILSKEGSAGEKIKESATYLGEDLWDSLTGAGRLMTSAATSAVNSVAYELPGSKQRQQRMEDEIFQTADAALLLHSLSFQDSIGSSGHTSNSKERYQRYVVTMPCEDFDPALEYSTKELWSRVVLKMIQSAFRNGLADALSAPVPKLTLRGESRLFLRENSKIADSDWLTYGASATDTNVYGISVSLYCGAKSSFKDDDSGPSSGPLLQCLEEGVKTNAHLRAASPWKLYFPDEVIVVAVFSSLEEAQCTEVPGAPGKLCSGATKVPDLDAHLIPGDKKSTDGVYQGMRSGSGFAKGTPYEITLRPEDLLEAAGILQRL